MNLEKMRKRVDFIAELGERDPELAHGAEDDMRLRFIVWVSESQCVPSEMREVALEIIRLDGVDFPRWCA